MPGLRLGLRGLGLGFSKRLVSASCPVTHTAGHATSDYGTVHVHVHGQLADTPTRGLDDSWTGQLAE